MHNAEFWFLGVGIEVWQIEPSLYAAKFSIVVKRDVLDETCSGPSPQPELDPLDATPDLARRLRRSRLVATPA